MTHTSPRWLNAANTQELPGYTRWNAMVGWRQAPWTVTLGITNLTDRTYWRASNMPGTPRTVRRLAVMFSPVMPSPRVAPSTSTPFS